MVIICLSVLRHSPGITSIRYPKLPYRKFGFTAWGVYRVPSALFPILLRHCGTFQEYWGIVETLAAFSAVTGSPVPRLIVSASTNTTSIAAGASMDLPNTTSAVLNYPRLAINWLFTVNANRNHRSPHCTGGQKPAVQGWRAVSKCPCSWHWKLAAGWHLAG